MRVRADTWTGSGQISVDRLLALAGIAVAILLIVLDKAGKLRGPLLYILLGLAVCLILPAPLWTSWITESFGMLKVGRIFIVCAAALGLYGGLAVWVSTGNSGQLDTLSGGADLYAEVLTALVGPIDQFYQHPPVYYKSLDTSLYISLTNQSDVPLYLRKYSVSALVGKRWVKFENADPGALWSDMFGSIIIQGRSKFIRRFDLSSSGFDYVMNQRPLAAHENLRLWMFFTSGITQDEAKIAKFKIIFYDSTEKSHVSFCDNQNMGITIGNVGSRADLTALNPESVPANLREEPQIK